MDGAGILYVADSAGTTIRRIALDGSVTTLAGSATNLGYANGTGAAVRFSGIKSLAIDAAGVLYAADRGNLAIRKITSRRRGQHAYRWAHIDRNSERTRAPTLGSRGGGGRHGVCGRQRQRICAFGELDGNRHYHCGSGQRQFHAGRKRSAPREPDWHCHTRPKEHAIAASRVYGPGVYGSVYVLTLP